MFSKVDILSAGIYIYTPFTFLLHRTIQIILIVILIMINIVIIINGNLFINSRYVEILTAYLLSIYIT